MIHCLLLLIPFTLQSIGFIDNIQKNVIMPPTSLENAQKSLIFLQSIKPDSKSKEIYDDYVSALTEYTKFKKNSEAYIKKCKSDNINPVPLIKILYANLLQRHPLLDFRYRVYWVDLSPYINMPPTNLENAQKSLVLLEGLKIGSFTDTSFDDKYNQHLNVIKNHISFSEFEGERASAILMCANNILTNKSKHIQLITIIRQKIDLFLLKCFLEESFLAKFIQYKESFEKAKVYLSALNIPVEDNQENIYKNLIFELKCPLIKFSVEKNSIIGNLPFYLIGKNFKINNKDFPLLKEETVENLYEEAKCLLSIEDECINVELVDFNHIHNNCLYEFEEFKRIKNIFTSIFKANLNNYDEIKKIVLELRELYYLYNNDNNLKNDFEKYYKTFLTLLKDSSYVIPQDLFLNTDFKNVPISSSTESSLYQSQDLTNSQYKKINDIEKEIVDENDDINNAFAYAKFIIRYNKNSFALVALEQLRDIQSKYGLTNKFSRYYSKLYREHENAIIEIINDNNESNMNKDPINDYQILNVSKVNQSIIKTIIILKDINSLTVSDFKTQINKETGIPLENIQLLNTSLTPMKNDKKYVINYLKPDTYNVIRVNDSRANNIFNIKYEEHNFQSHNNY